MSERLSVDRIEEIRSYWRETSLPYGANAIISDLLNELDAVTRERDEAAKRVSGLLNECARLINAREELRGERDEALATIEGLEVGREALLDEIADLESDADV